MADCHEQKTGLEPSQQPVEELVPHAGNEELFELIPDGVPVLKDSEVKHKLLQWNLNETLQLQRFRVKAKITPDVEEELVTQFFHNAHVQSTLSLPEALSSSAFKDAPQRIQCRKLRATATSLSFFDRLVPAGLVSGSGALRRCLDEVYDGATASDLLKEAFVSAEAEENLLEGSNNANWFSLEQDQQEFIFQLFRALVIGGAMCQSDESVQPYERMVSVLYKALVSVKKHASDSLVIDVTSRVYAVEDTRVLPASCVARFSTCFVILDPRKRWLTVWRHPFQPFW
uniref:Cilia- and flagella-associated protein 300 n=1 Tax=Globisporangium ultimum (strain ATCC 200006 / CBS 805.95 / DAOM BR144) TaxID=431595 RepID=K3WZF8_GLOUD